MQRTGALARRLFCCPAIMRLAGVRVKTPLQDANLAPVRDDRATRASQTPEALCEHAGVGLAALVATDHRGPVMDRRIRPLWRAADPPEILPSGDVTLREPWEGWSHRYYAMALGQYFAVRGTYPRTARMHPSTAITVAPADRVIPPAWPICEVRRHYAPARIILSDDQPQLPK